ncbi:MAG: hypothetical protein CNLJKLNK_00549 [Holosporales bacterium]
MTIYENPTEKGKYVVGVKQGGIDPIDLQKKIYEAEKLKAVEDKNNISLDSLKIKAMSQLQTYMQNLKTINKNLTNETGTTGTLANVFNNYIANIAPVQGVDSQTYISASATPGADVLNQTYDMQITQLAKTDYVQSSQISGWAAAMGYTGTLTIQTNQYPGASILVNPGDTLSTIIANINSQTSATGVIAEQTIPTIGANPILILRALNTADPITLTESLTDSLSLNPVGLLLLAPVSPATSSTRTVSQSSLQCQFTLNGIQYSRNSNSITDAISSVTFQAKAIMPAMTKITFGHDHDKIYSNIAQWVDAFNTVAGFLKTQNTKTEEEDPKGEHVLINDPIVEKTINILKQIRSGVFGISDRWDPSLPYSQDKDNEVAYLESLGIKPAFKEDPLSLLTFDSDALMKRINQSPENIQKMMGQNLNCANKNLVLQGMPTALSGNIAGTNLTLQIQNYNAATLTFDAVLTNGTLSETLTGISIYNQNLNFVNAFNGLKFTYTEKINAAKTINFSLTQGISSVLDHALSNYLQDPINVNRYETYDVTATNENFGDLSKRIYDVIQNKKKSKKKVERIENRAKKSYDLAIKKNESNNRIFSNLQAVRAMIEQFNRKKGS